MYLNAENPSTELMLSSHHLQHSIHSINLHGETNQERIGTERLLQNGAVNSENDSLKEEEGGKILLCSLCSVYISIQAKVP